MGFLGFGHDYMSERDNPDWTEYFDQQVEAGVKTDKWMGRGRNKVRIKGADGRHHTRSGAGCCGCGKHRDTEHPNYGRPPVIPGAEPPRKKRFGIF